MQRDQATDPLMTAGEWARVVVPSIAIGLVLGYLALRRLDFTSVSMALGTARVWPYVPLAAFVYLIGQLARGQRCRRIVCDSASITLSEATSVAVLGYATNNLLPARLGELARTALLGERAGISFPQAMAITLLERLLDAWAVLVLLLTGSAMTGVVVGSVRLAAIVAVLVSLSSAAMVALVEAPKRMASIAGALAGLLGDRRREQAERTTAAVSSALAILGRWRAALPLLAWTAAIWLLEGGMFALCLPAFGLPVKASWALLTMASTNLGILIPSTPGFIGPFHFFVIRSLTALGVGEAVAASYAVVVHLAFFLPVTLWGVAVLIRYGVEIGRVVRLRRIPRMAGAEVDRQGPSLEDPGPDSERVGAAPTPRASRQVRALVEAFAPAELGESPPATEVERVTVFVQGQLAALPRELRWKMRVGLLGFDALVILSHGRSFTRLPLARRREVIQAWAYGRVALGRKLFRPLRSTALLAFYESVPVPTGRSEVVR